MSNTIETNLKIYETTDYEQFIYLSENREVSVNGPLERAILERNKLCYNPIIVSKNMEVIDGQHRLNIARSNKIPIYYIIDNEAVINDIQIMNVGNKNWSHLNHLDFFCKLGKENYIFLKHLMNKYGVKGNSLTDKFTKSKYGAKSIAFRSGALEFQNDKEYIEDTCKKFHDITSKFTYFSTIKYLSKSFVGAILDFVCIDKYDHEFMLKKIDQHPEGLMKASKFNSKENCMGTLLDEVYNKGMRFDNRLSGK